MQTEHPLTHPQMVAAFAVAALFWGVGVTMIDPRTGVGIVLCLLGIAGTFWIFLSSFKAAAHARVRTWPWLAIALLAIEISIPCYLLVSRETKSTDGAALSSPTIEPDIPSAISEEFARNRVGKLGNPIGGIEVTTGIYEASHEHALIVSFAPTQSVFVFPKDADKKAVQYRYLTTNDDRKWWDDAFLRSRFHPPKDKGPPEFRVAELWDKNPGQWEWVGWREWSCPFTFEKFYYQLFGNGIIIGILPTEERLGSSQVLTFVNNGDWSSKQTIDKIGGVEAPACNGNTARVNGVPIHGRFVK